MPNVKASNIAHIKASLSDMSKAATITSEDFRQLARTVASLQADIRRLEKIADTYIINEMEP